MAGDIAQLKTLKEQARDAIAARDWDAAENLLARAKLELATLLTGAKGNSSVDADRRAIDDLLDYVKQQRRANSDASGMLQVPYERVRPGGPSC